MQSTQLHKPIAEQAGHESRPLTKIPGRCCGFEFAPSPGEVANVNVSAHCRAQCSPGYKQPLHSGCRTAHHGGPNVRGQ
jgi:hypothetical protein